jgi:hypothetical protein
LILIFKTKERDTGVEKESWQKERERREKFFAVFNFRGGKKEIVYFNTIQKHIYRFHLTNNFTIYYLNF